MTNLTKQPNATTTTPQAGPELTGPLRFWLLDETSESVAVETIAKSPILKAEAGRAIEAIRQEALRPASEDQIKAIVSSRFPLFPQPIRNDQEWAAWWADYFDALSGLTAPAVEAGMSAWVKSIDAEFMCKPGKLLELAKTTPNRNRWLQAHERARKATYEAPKPVPQAKGPELEKQTPEEVAAILKEFHAQIKLKEPPKAVQQNRKPPPSATLAEGRQMSPEMAALMERNRQREAET